MTREEAIKTIQKFMNWFKYDSRIYKALEMAIQALLQEPCTDAVSRAEVKKIVDFYTEQYDGIFHVNESIDKLPSITQKSKTGHWIDDADEIDAQYGRHMYRCQICDEYADYFVEGTDDWWHIKKPNFCSSCGAKMESEDKE